MICNRTFSNATQNKCFRQKKRTINQRLRVLLASGISIRRSALFLKINKGTVLRRIPFLGIEARRKNELSLNPNKINITNWQFDDLETFEHTKCKPLSVTLAVEAHTRLILGFEVSQMPATGLLSAKAKRKYGLRKDERAKGRARLFQKIAPLIHPQSVVGSDQNPHYPRDVKKYFPLAEHKKFKGKRGCITGQGELKKISFDPLFSLNHTCAMFRANVNRLFRKTWCTTKKRENLVHHLNIYMQFHNETLISRLK